MTDQDYIGLPFRRAGTTRDGCDCRGLALLWLREQLGVAIPDPPSDTTVTDAWDLSVPKPTLERGDLVFFRRFNDDHPEHLAVYLGGGRYLHTLAGLQSRIDNGLELLSRLQFTRCGILSPTETERVCRALANPQLGLASVPFLIKLGMALMLSYIASKIANPFPKSQKGRYSDQSTVTQTDPEVPLGLALGQIILAGNAVYTQLQDKSNGSSSTSKWNKIVVLSAGPVDDLDYETSLSINGTPFNSVEWKDSTGIVVNPEQTKAAAVTGSIAGTTNVPSVTLYDGAHAIEMPIDIRAQYDRTFPLYGMAGCTYLVFRLIDTAKFATFNLQCRVKGMRCRTFDASGFITTTATAESLTGADAAKVRFKLAYDDVIAVSALTVNSTSYTEIGPANQTGNVFSANRTKGYVEFITAPGAAATILITYTYHPRAWSENPISQMVYMLTEKRRGKGFDESKINWPSAVIAHDHADGQIVWNTGFQSWFGPRYQSDYAVDARRPVQEHLQALLDACQTILFLSAGKLVFRPRKAESSVFSFDPSTIVESSFSSEQVDPAQRLNLLKVQYHGEESQNAETATSIRSRSDQDERAVYLGNDGIQEGNVTLPAVTDLAHAQIVGHQMLGEGIHRDWMCALTTNIQGLALEPGDVVDVTHPSRPSWVQKLFRVEDLDYDDLDRLQVKLSEYSAAPYL
jgi:cell wall-associated NlpC family hydrolase